MKINVHKFVLELFRRFVSCAFMFLLGTLSFNLFYINDKLQMVQVINRFHYGQVGNDKKIINNLLTDDFIELGTKPFVQTPNSVNKSDVLNFDYSEANIESVKLRWLLLLNMLNNNNSSLSFIKETTFLRQSGNTKISFSVYVTYTFEKSVDGLKIRIIERKM